jgi:hypothetical protein
MSSLQIWTYVVVGATFALYIGIAFWARAGSTGEFYVAGGGVHPVANGMATAADWMSAASFISMAGLIAFKGFDASVYLMGWTGGYVLLALLLAPYLRKFGKFTVPEFIGDRFYSKTARLVAVICLIVASITYVIGQMKGVGVAFSRFLEVGFETGVIIGMIIVFFYAVLGGMVRRSNLRLHDPGRLYLPAAHREPPAADRSWQRVHARRRRQRRVDARQAGPGGHRSGLRGVHGSEGLDAEHVPAHPVPDDRHRGPAPRHHPLLHRSHRQGRPFLRGLGIGVHRHPLHHRPRGRRHGPLEPDRHHPDRPGG